MAVGGDQKVRAGGVEPDPSYGGFEGGSKGAANPGVNQCEQVAVGQEVRPQGRIADLRVVRRELVHATTEVTDGLAAAIG